MEPLNEYEKSVLLFVYICEGQQIDCSLLNSVCGGPFSISEEGYEEVEQIIITNKLPSFEIFFGLACEMLDVMFHTDDKMTDADRDQYNKYASVIASEYKLYDKEYKNIQN